MLKNKKTPAVVSLKKHLICCDDSNEFSERCGEIHSMASASALSETPIGGIRLNRLNRKSTLSSFLKIL